MNTLNSDSIDLKSNLKNILLRGINSFEDGFEILNVDLEVDESLTIDVLAKDGRGDLAVILFADNLEDAELIHNLLNILSRLRKHRFLLQHIYHAHEFDFSIPPKILLLSSRFSEEFLEKLDFIMAGDIIPYEYFAMKVENKDYLTFTRRDIDDSSDIKAIPLEISNNTSQQKKLNKTRQNLTVRKNQRKKKRRRVVCLTTSSFMKQRKR